MMIKYFFIVGLIVALVPTAMSNISVSADAEIALFSTGSLGSNGLSVSGNGDSAKMELKATNDNDKSNRVTGFQLTGDNVLSIEVGDKVTVVDNVDFTKAVTTDARDNQKTIGITSNGVIDFAGYSQGVYTLDVMVDDDRAYEAIVVIGKQPQSVIQKMIQRQIVDIDIRTEFEDPPKEKPSICYFDPQDEECDPIDGHCADGFGMNEQDRCVPTDDCPDGYARADWDETGTCFEEDKLVECENGDIMLPQYCRENENREQTECEAKGDGFVWEDNGCTQYISCEDNPMHVACYDDVVPPAPTQTPTPEPIEGECVDGATPVNGECPLPPGHKPGDAYCMALGCPGSPPHYPPDPGFIGGEPTPIEPEPEPIECSEGEESVDGQCQLITTNPVEPIDPLLIDENSDDQSIIGDDDSDESEDDGQGEESGGDDSEGSEESGGDDSEGSEESSGSEGETFA
jgi:hypothetical protein